MNTIISCDIETDGRAPGISSMVQLGAVAFNTSGKELASFSLNLQPLPGAKPDPSTMEWWSKQPEAIRSKVFRNPRDPRQVMYKFAEWVKLFKEPLLLCAPVMYDGTFIRFYVELFIGESVHGTFHNAVDLRSVIMSYTGQYRGDYRALITKLTGFSLPNHTHLAVEDAREQGQYFFALWNWAGKKGLRVTD